MLKKRTLAAAACAMMLVSVSYQAAAEVILEDTSGGGTNSAGYFGLTLLTPGSASGWNDISFNFWNGNATTAVATGTLYLLSAEYLGTPSELSSAAGIIATNTMILNGEWVFDSAVALQPNTQYWLYSDGLFASGSVSGPSNTTGYFTSSLTGNFSANIGNDPNYRLQGSASTVPEPGTVALVLLGALAGAGVTRRKRGSAL